jgi:AI-2 transport protein TqsA
MAAEPPQRSPASTLASGPIAALATVVLVLVGLLALREVASFVVPVLFGLFLALVAWPIVEVLERRGARHPVALTGAILVVLVIVLAAAAIAVFSIAELVLQVPKYADRFQSQLDELIAYLATFGVTLDQAAITSVISADRIVSVVRPVASGLSSAGIAIFVLVVTMIYALFGGSSLAGRAREAFGAGHGLLSGMDRFGNDLRRYLLVRAELGLFAAVLSFLLLLVLGVPFPALWAFLVFAASFIPNLGTFLAVLPPTVMAFLAVGVPQAIIVVVGYTLINFAQDHFLQPVLMGSELNLSPLVVFLSVLLWAWVLGPAGALLAVPITVGIVAIMESHPSTARIAALLRNSVEHGRVSEGPPDLPTPVTGDALPPPV